MGQSRRIRLAGVVVALLGALALAWAMGWRSGLSLAAGYAVGVAGFAGLAGAAAALTGSAGQRPGMLLAGMHLVKFPFLLAVLYLLLLPGRCYPVWLIVGYTVALVVFLREIASKPAPQASATAADTHE